MKSFTRASWVGILGLQAWISGSWGICPSCTSRFKRYISSDELPFPILRPHPDPLRFPQLTRRARISEADMDQVESMYFEISIGLNRPMENDMYLFLALEAWGGDAYLFSVQGEYSGRESTDAVLSFTFHSLHLGSNQTVHRLTKVYLVDAESWRVVSSQDYIPLDTSRQRILAEKRRLEEMQNKIASDSRVLDMPAQLLLLHGAELAHFRLQNFLQRKTANENLTRLTHHLGSRSAKNLLLVHGLCSSNDAWPAEDFTNSWSYGDSTARSKSTADFAARLQETSRDQGMEAYGFSGIGHSQGGLALLHMLAFHVSGLDTLLLDTLTHGGEFKNNHRLIQSLGSPYRGSSLSFAQWLLLFSSSCEGESGQFSTDQRRDELSVIRVALEQLVTAGYRQTRDASFFVHYYATTCGNSQTTDAVVSLSDADLTNQRSPAMSGTPIDFVDNDRECHAGSFTFLGIGYRGPAQIKNKARNREMNFYAARPPLPKAANRDWLEGKPASPTLLRMILEAVMVTTRIHCRFLCDGPDVYYTISRGSGYSFPSPSYRVNEVSAVKDIGTFYSVRQHVMMVEAGEQVDFALLEDDGAWTHPVYTPSTTINVPSRSQTIAINSNAASVLMRFELQQLDTSQAFLSQYAWKASPSGACSLPCGGGTLQQNISCISHSSVHAAPTGEREVHIVPDPFCEQWDAAGPKPMAQVPCNLEPCPTIPPSEEDAPTSPDIPPPGLPTPQSPSTSPPESPASPPEDTSHAPLSPPLSNAPEGSPVPPSGDNTDPSNPPSTIGTVPSSTVQLELKSCGYTPFIICACVFAAIVAS